MPKTTKTKKTKRRAPRYYVMGRDMDFLTGTEQHFRVAGPFRHLENAAARLDECQDFGNTESYVDYFLETR